MIRIGRVEPPYEVDAGKTVGVKKFTADMFLDDQGVPVLKISITATKIPNLRDYFAVLRGKDIYVFSAILDKAVFYNNLIYSFPLPEGNRGGVQRLTVRLDSKAGGEGGNVRGVITLEFFNPLPLDFLSEKDRSSTYYFFQPIQLVAIGAQVRDLALLAQQVRVNEKTIGKLIGGDGG